MPNPAFPVVPFLAYLVVPNPAFSAVPVLAYSANIQKISIIQIRKTKLPRANAYQGKFAEI